MHLGIDFGTCYSSGVLMLDGIPRPVKEPLKHGYSFPSSAFFTKQSKIVVGQAAENQYKLAPNHFCREFKRDFGITVPYTLGEQRFLPEQLVLELFRSIKIEAEQMANASLSTAIITVPATYQSYKRDLMRKVASQAGFENITLLEEPVAAATYYANKKGTQMLTEGKILLVYDLGGGTFDAALIQKNSQGYDLLAQPVGDEQLGGVDFDRQIYQDLKTNCSEALAEFLNPQRSDTDSLRAKLIVRDWCREFKHQLSVVSVYEDLLPMGITESYQLSQKDFAVMIDPFLQRTCELCSQLVKNAGLDWKNIDSILMVGGSCRIPAVKKVLEESFKRPLAHVDDPELAVAYGAALFKVSCPTRESEKSLESDATNTNKQIHIQTSNEIISNQSAYLKTSDEPNQNKVVDSTKHKDIDKNQEEILTTLAAAAILGGIGVFVLGWPIWLVIIFIAIRLVVIFNK